MYVHHGLHALSSIPHNTEDDFVKALRYSSKLISRGYLAYNDDSCPGWCILGSFKRPLSKLLAKVLLWVWVFLVFWSRAEYCWAVAATIAKLFAYSLAVVVVVVRCELLGSETGAGFLEVDESEINEEALDPVADADVIIDFGIDS